MLHYHLNVFAVFETLEFACLFVFSVVIEALKDVDPSRKCFRMIGGVLVERTVGDVLPALENNRTQV